MRTDLLNYYFTFLEFIKGWQWRFMHSELFTVLKRLILMLNMAKVQILNE